MGIREKKRSMLCTSLWLHDQHIYQYDSARGFEEGLGSLSRRSFIGFGNIIKAWQAKELRAHSYSARGIQYLYLVEKKHLPIEGPELLKAWIHKHSRISSDAIALLRVAGGAPVIRIVLRNIQKAG